MVQDSWQKSLLSGRHWHFPIWNCQCPFFTNQGWASILHSPCRECCQWLPGYSRLWNDHIFWTCKVWVRWPADGCSTNLVSCSAWNIPSLCWFPIGYSTRASNKLLRIFCIPSWEIGRPPSRVISQTRNSQHVCVLSKIVSIWPPRKRMGTSWALDYIHCKIRSAALWVEYGKAVKIWNERWSMGGGVSSNALLCKWTFIYLKISSFIIYFPELCDLQ